VHHLLRAKSAVPPLRRRALAEVGMPLPKSALATVPLIPFAPLIVALSRTHRCQTRRPARIQLRRLVCPSLSSIGIAEPSVCTFSTEAFTVGATAPSRNFPRAAVEDAACSQSPSTSGVFLNLFITIRRFTGIRSLYCAELRAAQPTSAFSKNRVGGSKLRPSTGILFCSAQPPASTPTLE